MGINLHLKSLDLALLNTKHKFLMNQLILINLVCQIVNFLHCVVKRFVQIRKLCDTAGFLYGHVAVFRPFKMIRQYLYRDGDASRQHQPDGGEHQNQNRPKNCADA